MNVAKDNNLRLWPFVHVCVLLYFFVQTYSQGHIDNNFVNQVIHIYLFIYILYVSISFVSVRLYVLEHSILLSKYLIKKLLLLLDVETLGVAC